MDFCPVDLNANLYLYEKNFEFFADELGDKAAAKRWARKAKDRKKLIRKYCRDPRNGMYYDYDYVNGKRSDVVSAAVFSLLYAGAVPIKDAPGIVRALDALEFPHGIAARIASKYAATVIRNFQKTRNLWEKYNVVEGNINVSNEYEMPTMVGWTAGTFVFATDYLDRTAR